MELVPVVHRLGYDALAGELSGTRRDCPLRSNLSHLNLSPDWGNHGCISSFRGSSVGTQSDLRFRSLRWDTGPWLSCSGRGRSSAPAGCDGGSGCPG